MRDQRRPGPANLLDQRAQNARKRDLAQIAQRKAGERDAHLHAGNHAAEIAEQLLDNFGARDRLSDQLPDARKAHGDERKLRGGEKRVHADQKQDAEDVQGAHVAVAAALQSERLISRLYFQTIRLAAFGVARQGDGTWDVNPSIPIIA